MINKLAALSEWSNAHVARYLPFLAHVRHGSALSYALTCGLMALALWLRLSIAPVSAGLQYVTFFPSVTLAAIFWGYRAGLLATAIGLTLATYIFTPPYFSISYAVIQTSMWSNMVFLVDGVIISLAIEILHQYRHRSALELRDSRGAYAALEGRTYRLRTILDNLYAYVALLDLNGVIQEVNLAPLDGAYFQREEIIGSPFCDVPWWTYDATVHARLIEALVNAKNGQLERYDVTVAVGDRLVPIDFQLSPVRDGAGQITGLLAMGVDISARLQVERSLQQSESELRIAAAAFDSAEGIMITDADGTILRVNKAFTEATGYAAEELIGQTPRLLKSGRHDASFYADMWDSIKRRGMWEGEIWDRRKNGEIYPKWLTITAVSHDGQPTHYVAAQLDITARKRTEDEIRSLAFYDALTELPNRRLLLDRLGRALATSARNGHYGSLLFIDLDNFKALNDTCGHAIGDLLLQQVAQRLVTCVREGDTVARLGGDEFVVMLEDLSETIDEATAQTEAVGKKILATLNVAYLLAGYDHRSTPSIGVSLFKGHGRDIEELLKQADQAMYRAKKSGRNALCFYDPVYDAANVQ